MDKTSDSYLNQAFEILGKRWNGLIISVLMSGEKRFSDIADQFADAGPAAQRTRAARRDRAYGLSRNTRPDFIFPDRMRAGLGAGS